MRPLAKAGFHVLAPDQRGYGRTTATDPRPGADLAANAMPNLILDVLGMLRACGIAHVACVVGHDFGASVAAWCALLHADVFQSVALMSSPFAGPPCGSSANPLVATPVRDIHQDLAQLARPRKHYQWYYATPTANTDMWQYPQGVHAFLRAIGLHPGEGRFAGHAYGRRTGSGTNLPAQRMHAVRLSDWGVNNPTPRSERG